jgi:hypothetical protein
VQAALGASLALARQLAVSYAGLTLMMDMFPQVLTGHWQLRGSFSCWGMQHAAACRAAGCSPMPAAEKSWPACEHSKSGSVLYLEIPAVLVMRKSVRFSMCSLLSTLQPAAAAQRGPLQLLDSLDAAAASSQVHHPELRLGSFNTGGLPCLTPSSL